jgi:hypothetical protein
MTCTESSHGVSLLSFSYGKALQTVIVMQQEQVVTMIQATLNIFALLERGNVNNQTRYLL